MFVIVILIFDIYWYLIGYYLILFVMDFLIGYKILSIVYKCNFRKVVLYEFGYIIFILLIEYLGIFIEVRCKYKFYIFNVLSY